MSGMGLRILLYGLLGISGEVVFTSITASLLGWNRRPGRPPAPNWRLEGYSYLWMLPFYAASGWLYERLTLALQAGGVPLLARGVIYMAVFYAIEFVFGWLTERLIGVCPWDYREVTRWTWRGYVRLEFAPIWYALGILLEGPVAYLMTHT
jgi:hypothetical protein